MTMTMASTVAKKHQPARFMSIPDLLARGDPSEEGLLRVIGRLEGYDVEHSILWLQDHKAPLLQMAVDSSNIEPFPFKRGLLYQFIGEVDYREIPVVDGSTSMDHVISEGNIFNVSERTKVDHKDAATAPAGSNSTVSEFKATSTIENDCGDLSVVTKEQVLVGDKIEVGVPVAAGYLAMKRAVRCVMMKALLCRCVDGLDMDVFLRAHDVRMRLISASADNSAL